MVRTYKYQSIKNSIAKMSVESLIEEFNTLVRKRYWTSARAAHDAAVINSLVKQGIDVSAVYDGRTISFQHQVILDAAKSRLIMVTSKK